MTYGHLGRSGLTVSRIGLGTMNFGYLVDHIDTKEAFFAYELGALVIPSVILAAILYWRRKDWW